MGSSRIAQGDQLGADLEEWDKEGGRETQEGLIHFVIKQKLTHHCIAIILQ